MSFTVEIRENGKRVSLTNEVDPFIHTTIRVRGWRQALAILLRRYEAEVVVNADHATVEAVLELNPDYLGEPGSRRRARWDKELDAALHSFADSLPNDEASDSDLPPGETTP